MVPELKKAVLVVVGAGMAGTFLGVLLGRLTGEYLLWVGVFAGLGAILGLARGYGFLPES